MALALFNKVGNAYEHALACAYHRIDKRGLLIDEVKRDKLHLELQSEINRNLAELSKSWNCHVYIGAANNDKSKDSINLNSSSGANSLVNSLKRLGYAVPKIRKRNKEDNSISMKDSAGDEALERLFAETADQNIKRLLDIRELNTLDTRYATAYLYRSQWFCIYNVAGTETGRRGSKAHIFGIGGNSQNFPKHTDWASRFRECIVARPGCIFLNVDQVSAEEWPVQALAENEHGLAELADAAVGKGYSRHAKLASIIFNLPVEQILKSSMEYYMGKKGRHANNYGMRAKTFSQQCAQQGFAINEATCKVILDKINKADPKVDSVFHEYVKTCLYNSRTLVTPFGRERVFFGLRDRDANFEIWNKAYAYIPQSTVADNTGLAILSLDAASDWVVQENHDSITQELPDNERAVRKAFRDVVTAFDREIVFYNGINVKIPIEGELSYDFDKSVKIKEMTEDALMDAYNKIREIRNAKGAQEALAGSIS